jgi:hypothetical protein
MLISCISTMIKFSNTCKNLANTGNSSLTISVNVSLRPHLWPCSLKLQHIPELVHALASCTTWQDT